jgi:anti-sigma factor RsiW
MTEPRHMPCTEFVELVTDYVEGALDEETTARFEAHLALCPGCVTYLEQIRETIEAMGELHEDDLSPEARTHLLDAFRDWVKG